MRLEDPAIVATECYALPHMTYFRSRCSPCNRIYILDGLPKGEGSASRRTTEDVLDEVFSQDPESFTVAHSHVQRLDCHDRAAYDAAMVTIRKDSEAGARPLIFIHGHGDEDSGLQLASGESVPWSIYLEQLESITLAAAGELTVIAAFCHSMAIIPSLPAVGRLPFAFYYGYDNVVSAGQAQDETAMLNRALLRDGGKSAANSSASLRCYSEYDHIDLVLAAFSVMTGVPTTGIRAFPDLTKRKLLREMEPHFSALGLPRHETRKLLSNALQSNALVEVIFAIFMHDTERRQRMICDLTRWRDQMDRGEPSNAVTNSIDSRTG